MARRPVINVLIALVATLILAAPAMAQGAKTYAVLPFVYNGPQKYEYFSKAVQASLENDLEWLGHVEPTTKSLNSVGVPKDKGAALSALRSLGVDYIMYGRDRHPRQQGAHAHRHGLGRRATPGRKRAKSASTR